MSAKFPLAYAVTVNWMVVVSAIAIAIGVFVAPLAVTGLVLFCLLSLVWLRPAWAAALLAVAIALPFSLNIDLWKAYRFSLAWAALPMMALLTLAFTASAQVVKPRGRFDRFAFVWLVATGLAIMLSSVTFAPLSLSGLVSYGRFVLIVGGIWYLRPFLATERDIERFLYWLLVAAGLSAIVVLTLAIYHQSTFLGPGAGERGRLAGGPLFGWPNGIAFLYASLSTVSVAVGLNLSGPRRYAAYIVAVLCGLLVVSTLSRTGLVGLAIALPVFAWYAGRGSRRLIKGWMGIGAAVVGIAGLIALPPIRERLLSTFGSEIGGGGLGFEGATYIRVLLIVRASEFLHDHPSVLAFGSGFRSYIDLIPSIGVTWFEPKSSHNQYLDAILRGGIPMLAGYVVFVARLFATGRYLALRGGDRSRRYTGAAAAALALAVGISNLTQEHLFFEPTFILFICGAVILNQRIETADLRGQG